jgi:predicted alpha/beta hydrolase
MIFLIWLAFAAFGLVAGHFIKGQGTLGFLTSLLWCVASLLLAAFTGNDPTPMAFVFGILGIFTLTFLPDIRRFCEKCRKKIHPQATKCPYCHSDCPDTRLPRKHFWEKRA